MITTKDFYYELPEGLIAQEPADPRDSSKLMVLDRADGNIKHSVFTSIIDHLNPGDILVLNDTKVIPVKIFAHKITEGRSGAKIELLLYKNIKGNIWETMIKNTRRLRPGISINIDGSNIDAKILDKTMEGNVILEFPIDIKSLLHEIGEIPLPPYVKKIEDRGRRTEISERYQTIFAKNDGAAAAPTAGLHFTQTLLEKIKTKGVHIAYITLHTSLGTFLPVREEDLSKHKIFEEYFEISEGSAEQINRIKDNGGKVIACGTTVVRALETNSKKDGRVDAGRGATSLFIYPPYEFKMVDHMITNFHLPCSTLLMLVSALAGKENIFKAYQEAIRKKYRFYSFGDAMAII
ncbi:MAG: tRNA preQ1(34) S-adenosylmethionine ribosyltransferase-isomerase QueA [bacterium]